MGRRKLLGVMGMFFLLVVIVSEVYTYIRKYQIVQFKYVQILSISPQKSRLKKCGETQRPRVTQVLPPKLGWCPWASHCRILSCGDNTALAGLKRQ